jgi:sec-independent protein translocase protein TatA
MPFGIGPTEMIILLLVLLVVFGPKRLPDMGKQLGKGMREFKDSISGKDDPDEADDYTEPLPAALPSADVVSADSEAPVRERDTASSS